VRPTESLLPGHVYGVSELLGEVSRVLSSGWRQISVAGQTSEVRRYPSGHVYLSLKDETGKLSAVMWRSDASRLKFVLEDGLEVVATGTLGLYAARGQFQLQVARVEPVGIGALALAFEQLRARLAAEGLFDAERKRPLPFLPRRIGVVTSPQGAAIRDFLNVLARRHPDLGVTIYPVRVQGEEAAEEIAEGIRRMGAAGVCDVLVVTRGGGSAEDLAAFNDERVARALAASRIPTVSAVGHEVDWTIADYVADLRAPTPSAAAELVIGAKDEIARRLSHARRSLQQLAGRRLAELRGRWGLAARSEALLSYRHVLARRRDRFEAARDALRAAAASRPRLLASRVAAASGSLLDPRRLLAIDRRRERLGRLASSVRDKAALSRARAQGRFRTAAERLRALDPLSILSRGYAVVFPEGEDRPATDAGALSVGDAVRIRLRRGSLRAAVTEIFPEEET
jgi:exodeoxyribonuclease VII large subunit